MQRSVFRPGFLTSAAVAASGKWSILRPVAPSMVQVPLHGRKISCLCPPIRMESPNSQRSIFSPITPDCTLISMTSTALEILTGRGNVVRGGRAW